MLLIIGQTGQLSGALARECNRMSVAANFLNRQDFDLSAEPRTLRKILDTQPIIPSAIINAAAYTAVDKAETDAIIAHQVNARAPQILAEYCAAHDIPLIHISTDYVFNGSNHRAYTPTDLTDPLGVYGATKLAGETAIISSGCRAVILRTSWVYDGYGKNFLTTMLHLAGTHNRLRVVEDQIGRPTYTADLARACLAAVQLLIDKPAHKQKIYHISNIGAPISWAGFARAIFTAAANHLPHKIQVDGIASHEYPTAAKRPLFSVMDCTGFERDMNVTLRDWTDGMHDAIGEWVSQQ